MLCRLDLTVLKYLASRGYTEAHAALRRGIGLEDGQVGEFRGLPFGGVCNVVGLLVKGLD